jgi:hypothetical protein
MLLQTHGVNVLNFFSSSFALWKNKLEHLFLAVFRANSWCQSYKNLLLCPRCYNNISCNGCFWQFWGQIHGEKVIKLFLFIVDAAAK